MGSALSAASYRRSGRTGATRESPNVRTIREDTTKQQPVSNLSSPVESVLSNPSTVQSVSPFRSTTIVVQLDGSGSPRSATSVESEPGSPETNARHGKVVRRQATVFPDSGGPPGVGRLQSFWTTHAVGPPSRTMGREGVGSNSTSGISSQASAPKIIEKAPTGRPAPLSWTYGFGNSLRRGDGFLYHPLLSEGPPPDLVFEEKLKELGFPPPPRWPHYGVTLSGKLVKVDTAKSVRTGHEAASSGRAGPHLMHDRKRTRGSEHHHESGNQHEALKVSTERAERQIAAGNELFRRKPGHREETIVKHPSAMRGDGVSAFPQSSTCGSSSAVGSIAIKVEPKSETAVWDDRRSFPPVDNTSFPPHMSKKPRRYGPVNDTILPTIEMDDNRDDEANSTGGGTENEAPRTRRTGSKMQVTKDTGTGMGTLGANSWRYNLRSRGPIPRMAQAPLGSSSWSFPEGDGGKGKAPRISNYRLRSPAPRGAPSPEPLPHPRPLKKRRT